MTLAGRVALVSGGSRGIGRAIAEELVGRGAAVAVAARTARDAGGVMGIPTDITDYAAVQAFMARADSELGPPDIVVNNAAVSPLGLVEHADPADWRRTIETNLLGTIHVTRAALDRMLPRRTGHVDNITSDSSRLPRPYLATYCATKSAVNALTAAVRHEVSERGIRVSLVEVGGTRDTGFSDGWSGELFMEARAAWEQRGMGLSGPPLVPADIARAVAFVVDQPPGVGVDEIVVRPTLPSPNS